MRRVIFIIGLVMLLSALAAGVAFAATKIGDNQSNTINGTVDNDNLYGIGAADIIDGKASNDFIEGGLGNDRMEGGFGNDDMSGGTGSDDIFGEGGNDFIVAGRGEDEVFGGPGNDYIVVTDNVYANDTVDCGEGDHDVLVFDEDITGDTWANCELTDGINSDPLAGP